MIEIIKADITTLKVDAIVSSSNTTLTTGSGVAGAVFNAAGNELVEICRYIGGCRQGDAVITDGYNLLAKYIIHAVAPIWYGGQYNEEVLLESAYKNSLDIAVKNNIKTIAFSGLGIGAFSYPKVDAARIAIHLMRRYEHKFDKIICCVYEDEDEIIYRDIIK